MRCLAPFFTLLVIITSCKGDENILPDNNNFLPNIAVDFRINLDLPEYDSLDFPGGSFEFANAGISTNGVVIYNIDNNQFTAFDLTDPNHPIQDCSKLVLKGIEATCSCEDGNTYNIVTGQRKNNPEQVFALRRYRITKSGRTLFVTN